LTSKALSAPAFCARNSLRIGANFNGQLSKTLDKFVVHLPPRLDVAEMSSWRRRVEERKLLRLLVNYLDMTSERAPDPASHARLLAALRQELAELEIKGAARARRFAPIYKLVGFVFGRARAV
jgi:hypothetical protein